MNFHSIKTRTYLLLALIAVEFMSLFWLRNLLEEAERDLTRVDRLKTSLATTHGLINLVYSAGKEIAENPGARIQYASQQELFNDLALIRETVKSQESAGPVLQTLESSIQDALKLTERARKMLDTVPMIDRPVLAVKLKQQLTAILGRIYPSVADLVRIQQKMVAHADIVHTQSRSRVVMLVESVVALNALVAFLLVVFLQRNVLSRLALVVDNTNRLAGGKPLMPVMSGKDELGHLDRVFHDMAQQLQDASRKERETTQRALAAEARVKLVIESMPIGLCIVNCDGEIRYVNQTMERIFGYSSDELRNEHISCLIKQRPDRTPAEFFAEVRAQYIGRVAEFSGVTADCAEIPIEFSLSELKEDNELSYLAIFLDVSERYELEKLKKAFVSMVSHELRTPLTSVIGFFSLLHKNVLGSVSDRILERSNRAERNLKHVMKLINDLLDAEKLKNDKLSMIVEPTPIGEVVRSSLDAVTEFAEKHNVELSSDIDETLVVNADGDRLKQVLINLLSNAIKYSPPGAPVVVSVQSEHNMVRFNVKDRGRGVPKHLQEAIFEKFRQVESDDAKKKGGTGLGLAICKAIVEQHGGLISVVSEDGEGSNFSFTIPSRTEVADL